MRKILITGGAGFIGSNLARFLIQETADHVLVLDKLTYAGNLESLADISGQPRFEFQQLDICCADQLVASLAEYRPDAVIHLAAESHVDRSIDGPDEFIRTNLVGTYEVLEAGRRLFASLSPDEQRDFRIVHVSTDEVYGSLATDDPAFSETTPYDPHSPYSASKAGSDHLARAWHTTYGLPVLVTNCSNNYGPFQFPEKLIPVVILKALHGEPIPVYGRGENVRDWLFVADHARALYEVATRGTPGETYNIGGNNELKNIDLVRMICRILDEFVPCQENPDVTSAANPGAVTRYEQLISFVEDRPGHDLRYAIDASKIRRELGWQPAEAADSGFRKTVQWYLDHRDWWSHVLSGEYQLKRQGLGQN